MNQDDFKEIIDRFEGIIDRRDKHRDELDQIRHDSHTKESERLGDLIKQVAASQKDMAEKFTGFLEVSSRQSEQYAHLAKTIEDHGTWNHDQDKRLSALEIDLSDNKKAVSVFTRIAFIVLTAFIGGWITMYYAKSI
jgi:hypothetical protein